jgi:predicted GNAT superfamily acetyltransferase
VARLFDRVWGVRSMVSPEVIVAGVHNGAYASLARVDGSVVGAAFAFVGRALDGESGPNLHSHAAGVLPEWSGRGVGEIIKRHQWYWARDNGFATITWTFDPLVRRNAWFNLVRLGVRVLGYHENFYGELTDGINAGEQSDRLLVRWDVHDGDGPPRGRVVEPDVLDLLIDTPQDIESLRAIDRAASSDWRSRQRAAFGGAGDRIVAGLSSSYAYVLRTAN